MRTQRLLPAEYLAILGLFVLCVEAHAVDWPCWRGPNYDGISPEKNFKTSWSEPPKSLWQYNIGSAYSGISIAGGRLYTCGSKGNDQVMYCFDVDTQKLVWQAPIEKAYSDGQGDGPRSTPTVDGDRVYILGALGSAVCFDAKDGKKIWSRSYGDVPKWGYSGSILVEGDLAILTAGGSGGGMVALDKNSGKERWRCGDDEDAGYSTPLPFEFGGKKYVCGFLGNNAVVAEIETGKEVLNIPWKTDWKVNAATPIYHDGHLFLTSGYSTGSGLFKLEKVNGRLGAKEIWRSRALLCKFQTPVLYDGHLYAFDQNAFKCVDFRTGEERWKQHGRNGTIVIADGKLIALTEQGALMIGPASSKGFEPTGEAELINDKCWTVPTLLDGRLYIRDLEKIACFDLRAAQ